MQQSKITTKTIEQGVEVIIRIKPIFQEEKDQLRCISISDCEENTIVVETNNKRELFSFDYIASQQCGQQELYQKLGKPVLQESLKGYNCCVFSYGQTGAGKTYSILGQATQLIQDEFSQSRGILPRLLEQLFSKINSSNNKFQQVNISCSYLQIYNEQIIDLLTRQSRTLSIRQDIQKGVYIDGITEISITNYEQVLGLIIKGLTIRKTASTFMNSQSSRSHTIFTMFLNTQFYEGQIKKSLRSKLHIIDLAGSQRIKLTKVDGERLKQGCNINKSLLTLSHVISSLVQSQKKKKHIPFRDSKLTFFLKDSLGGNSKTKLLANISSRVSYIGDTISTLMFAKRAKIIKSKVQLNENIADNFESLRTQIRKLRQQLAKTKFIQTMPSNFKTGMPSKIIQNVSPLKSNFLPIQSIVQTPLNSNISKNSYQSLKIFQENENSYRTIVQHCLSRLKQYGKGITVKQNFKTLFQQKKNLQKTVLFQQKLLSNFPAFTKLFTQNIEHQKKIKILSSELSSSKSQIQNKNNQVTNLQNTIQILNADIQHLQEKVNRLSKLESRSRSNSGKRIIIDKIIQDKPKQQKFHHRTHTSQKMSGIPILSLAELKHQRKSSVLLTKRGVGGFRDIVERQNNIIDQYQQTIQEIKNNFMHVKTQMQTAYATLEQMYQQQKRQKHEICKRKRKQPEMQSMQNQNQYLKLNVMQLQSQIEKLEKDVFKKGIQIKTFKEERDQLQQKIHELQNKYHINGFKQVELEMIIEKVSCIKLEAQKQTEQLNNQINKYVLVVLQLQNKLTKQTNENYILFTKNQTLLEQINSMKNKYGQTISLDESNIISKQGNGISTFDQQSTVFQHSWHEDMMKDMNILNYEKDKLKTNIEQLQKQKIQQTQILQKTSLKILNITKQMNMYKQITTVNAQQISLLSQKISHLQVSNKNNFDKCKFLEVDFNRLKKQNEKKQYLISEVVKEVNCQPEALLKQIKHIKLNNQHLLNQNIKLQQKIHEIQRKTSALKNSKSLSNLPTVRQFTSTSMIKTPASPNSKLHTPISKYDIQNSIKKKQVKRGVFSTLQQDKQKSSFILKLGSKPVTQEKSTKFKKNLNLNR